MDLKCKNRIATIKHSNLMTNRKRTFTQKLFGNFRLHLKVRGF